MRRLKAFLKAHWPALTLRTILFGVLLFTAAMPGLGAVFLRVYENVLVRQTEAELIAQAAAFEAAFVEALPGGAIAPAPPPAPDPASASVPMRGERTESWYTPDPLTIDLNTMPILPERPKAVAGGPAPAPPMLAAAKAILPLVTATRRTTLASVRVLDANGVVLLGGGEEGLSYAAVPEVQAALAGKRQAVLRRRGDYVPRYAFEVLSRASAIRVHVVRPIFGNDGKVVGAVLLSRSPRALFRGIYDDLGKIAVGVVVIFLVILALAGLLSRSIARPIERLTLATGHVARGGTDLPETPATAAIEIRALFDNFRRMAGEIDRRSRYLRDFAGAVSHEFKTPLAGIRGALELLDEHGETMSEAERRRFLANAGGDAERLSHLVGRLLELARADMATVSADIVVDAVPALRRVADAARAPALAIDLVLAEGLPPVAVAANVIEAVVTTLIENSRQAGASTIAVTVELAPPWLTVRVADNGPGIAPGDRERLFEPFFTTRRSQGGTGLGLPIARSLLAASRSEIELGEGESGSCFVLRLRLAGMG